MKSRRTHRSRLFIVGHQGSRLIWALVGLGLLAIFGSEQANGTLSETDRYALPALAAGFGLLCLLAWIKPSRLGLWQRIGSGGAALYFAANLLRMTLQGDPGPPLYELASLGPWLIAGLLLLFITWPADKALWVAGGLVACLLLPASLRTAVGALPAWLHEAWPWLINLGLSAAVISLGLWVLARQLGRLISLAPQLDSETDLTPEALLKARLAEIDRARLQAEQASRAKSEFLAAMGHEIRTPMNTVLGMTRLAMQSKLEAPVRKQLDQVVHAGESLVRLLDGMLDYAALDAGQLQLQPEPLRIEDLLSAALDPVRQSAQAKQVELQCEILSPELLGSAGWRLGDRTRITQVLSELLVNAVKFTSAGQVRVSAWLDSAATPAQLIFKVRDTGIGIAPEQLSVIFSPFSQADSGATRSYGGTGLGLAVTQRLTRLMNGTLQARSVLGRGSEFELSLPLPPANAGSEPAGTVARQVMLIQASQSTGHEQLVSLLGALAPKARLEIAGQGEAGLHLLAAQPVSQAFDLLIVDWVLPDMDAASFMQNVAALGPPPRAQRVVLLSAFDTPALRDKAARLGAHALCAKPVLPATLRTLLNPRAELPEPLKPLTGADPGQPSLDRDSLIQELDSLLEHADSDALDLWENHASDFMDFLPPQQVKALAGAMQRFDFDEAQAALRAAQATRTDAKERP
jgi:signal transduction histidine kinase/CheY-like chemotaxis protein